MSSRRQERVQTNARERSVCIIHPNRFAYSETFIRAHIERLPARVKVLHGTASSGFAEDNEPLPSSPLRGLYSLISKALGTSPEELHASALRRYLRREKIDTVLAEYGPTGVGVMEACDAEGVPLVVHFHGYDAHDDGVLEAFGGAYSRLFRLAARVVAASQHMRDRLIELGASPEKVLVNPYGVDTSLFSGANPASSPPVFLAVGRFVDKKAPYLTLLAIKETLQHDPDARLVAIGDGPVWEACRQLAKALGIAHAVEFLGPRSHSDVASAMRGARAFVQHSIQTSYGDSEGLPVAILEACASGLPVIATRHTGIPEVVIDGKTGLLVDEGDLEGMSRHMIQLSTNSGLAARLGQAGRDRICESFSIERSISNLSRILDTAIGKHGES